MRVIFCLEFTNSKHSVNSFVIRVETVSLPLSHKTAIHKRVKCICEWVDVYLFITFFSIAEVFVFMLHWKNVTQVFSDKLSSNVKLARYWFIQQVNPDRNILFIIIIRQHFKSDLDLALAQR